MIEEPNDKLEYCEVCGELTSSQQHFDADGDRCYGPEVPPLPRLCQRCGREMIVLIRGVCALCRRRDEGKISFWEIQGELAASAVNVTPGQVTVLLFKPK